MSRSLCRSGSTAKKNDDPPPPKRPRRHADLPENANKDLFTFHEENDLEYEDFSPLTFNKPIPPYLSNNFNTVPSLDKEGKIILNDSLIALTISEGDSANFDKFSVHNHNKELAGLFKLINSPTIKFWPKGKCFLENHKRKFFFEIENIRRAISSFQGHAALAQLAFPSKINDIDFITKVIICPLKKHIDLITSLIKYFRAKALPKTMEINMKSDIINAEIQDIWVLTEDQITAITSCFRSGPLHRGGDASLRGFTNSRFKFQNRFRGKFGSVRGSRGFPGYRGKFATNRREYRRSKRGGSLQGGPAANSSEVKENKTK